MDLRSEALALRHPFRVVDPLEAAAHGPIENHAIIGDGTTVALVRVDGAIDWLCWPRFDSPPVFSQLLDAEQGGVTAVGPASRPFESLQRYDPDTAVLETLMSVPEQGSLRITDYMPWSNDPRAAVREIHRRVECVRGQVEVEVVFDPRFDFGRAPHRVQVQEHGLFAQAGESRLALASEGEFEPRPEGGWRRRFQMSAGDRTWVILSWGAQKVEPLRAYRPFELLRSTRRAWRDWAQRLTYDGPWRHLVLRSAMTLKLLQYAPTGALVAAPTTSLPEWIGGIRNWDYRYAWARDAGLSVRAANLIGFGQEARDYFHFMRESLAEHDAFHIMLTVDGKLVPPESEVPNVAGYRNSGPVRVGNGAHDQIQIDSAGYVMDAAWVFERQISVVNHVGLLAEEVDPSSKSQLGNFPQAFSHVGLISAACRIDLALRQQDEGRARTPLFELER